MCIITKIRYDMYCRYLVSMLHIVNTYFFKSQRQTSFRAVEWSTQARFDVPTTSQDSRPVQNGTQSQFGMDCLFSVKYIKFFSFSAKFKYAEGKMTPN